VRGGGMRIKLKEKERKQRKEEYLFKAKLVN
jgi:hypothetical protein